MTSQADFRRQLETVLVEIPGLSLVVYKSDELDSGKYCRKDILQRLKTSIIRSDSCVMIISWEATSPGIPLTSKEVSNPVFFHAASSKKDVREDDNKFSDHIEKKKTIVSLRIAEASKFRVDG